MESKFEGWAAVSDRLCDIASKPQTSTGYQLNDGQRATLRALAKRLPENGVVIADEVGMGKTRIAAVVTRCVNECGGRVSILVPPGLGFQWQAELRSAGAFQPLLLRSIQQYLNAWGNDVPLRGQRSGPATESEPVDGATQAWFSHPVVMLSHAFTNWKLGATSKPWRWALLPELVATWRKSTTNRLPRGYFDEDTRHKLSDGRVQRAARSIVEMTNAFPAAHTQRVQLADLVERTPWPGSLEAVEYSRGAALRLCLEQAVGFGLGMFDLVIIDEAHKGRGGESGITRLLEHVVLPRDKYRRLALTATPIELNTSQWAHILTRIGAAASPEVEKVIAAYATAVERVRQCPSNADALRSFTIAAQSFKGGLSPWLLRRDKREDALVQGFAEATGKPMHSYRQEEEILIETKHLPERWRHAVCAAEALSLVTYGVEDRKAKRLRLTLGNGHGIATLLDEVQRDQDDDCKQNKVDEMENSASGATDCAGPVVGNGGANVASKRRKRTKWWMDTIRRVLIRSDRDLFDHPAILAAVEAIERSTESGEKVLVFGRFTSPMQKLVQLLNAREMLRCLERRKPWPQSKVHAGDDEAIKAGHRQLSCTFNLAELNGLLERQYAALESDRERFRTHLIERLDEGLKADRHSPQLRRLFEAFCESVVARSNVETAGKSGTLAIVARALHALTGPQPEAADLARAFAELITAASDRDAGASDVGDGEDEVEENRDETEGGILAATRWQVLEARLTQEYGRLEGGFARLMNGKTEPDTRRLLQLAFNRMYSYPRVLVAQSLVGREGLNLHLACRTVVLLHPEWNPGVVEQQIGRVDRLGSLWERQTQQAISDKMPAELFPLIRVQPVIFQGTYDENNWKVLRARWDDLRAQLHGVVISPQFAENFPEMDAIVKIINDGAPNFSPLAAELGAPKRPIATTI